MEIWMTFQWKFVVLQYFLIVQNERKYCFIVFADRIGASIEARRVVPTSGGPWKGTDPLVYCDDNYISSRWYPTGIVKGTPNSTLLDDLCMTRQVGKCTMSLKRILWSRD